MVRNITYELLEELGESTAPKRGRALWSLFPFNKAFYTWLRFKMLDIFHQWFRTGQTYIQFIECIVEKEVTIKITSLNPHLYLLYILGDPVYYYNNKNNSQTTINTNQYVAGYCPKGIFYLKLKPGNYTIVYVNPSSTWLLEFGRQFTFLAPLYNMIETEHTQHEILSPGFISPKEHFQLLKIRSAKPKSPMGLTNYFHDITEALLYRCHQRLENEANNIFPERIADLERIRAEIRNEVRLGNTIKLYAIHDRLRINESEMRKEHQREYKQTLIHYSKSVRMELANTLLIAGEKPIDVFGQVGCSSPQDLSTQYKSIFGYSPSQAKEVDKKKKLDEKKNPEE